jgi:hypothetical protein
LEGLSFLDKATTGNTWKTYKVISGPEIKKIPAKDGIGEIWGKYPKIYSKMLLGGGGAFNPPQQFLIDNVRVICPCSDIKKRFYGTAQNGSSASDIGLKAKIISGLIIPACWEDYTSISSPYGDNTYDIHVRHPQFYINTISENGIVGAAGVAKNVATGKYGSVGGIIPAGIAGFVGYKMLKPKGGRRKTRKILKKNKIRRKS